jgi:hypothetical protein
MRLTIRKKALLVVLISLFLFACNFLDIAVDTGQPAAQAPSEPPAVPPTTAPTDALALTDTPAPADTPIPTDTAMATSTITEIPTSTPTASYTPTETPTLTETPTPTFTPIPTYVVLRGKVIIDQAVCHYGPGAPYLYKYGVYKDSNMEIVGRESTTGEYIEVQAIGGDNRCWVKAEYYDIQGDIKMVQPVDAETYPHPQSPYYGPLTGVSAVRSGDQVTVSWNALVLRAGDDSLQTPYIVEAWVCQNGQFIFVPAGSWTTSVTILDEPGCSQSSHARVIAAEKHGYTNWVAVPWPPQP